MSRRTERLGSLMREAIGQAVLRLSDPRIDPAVTSVTRVDVQEDLLRAIVYVSVHGTEAEARRTLHGLRHAAGRLQESMLKKVSIRHTPRLEFALDERFRKTLETLEIIEQAMTEIREKEAREGESADVDAAAGGAEGPHPDEGTVQA